MDLIFLEITDEKDIETLESYLIYEDNEGVDYLPKVGKINLFLGANNSGKSQFLRFLINNQSNILGLNLPNLNSNLVILDSYKEIFQEAIENINSIDFARSSQQMYIKSNIEELLKGLLDNCFLKDLKKASILLENYFKVKSVVKSEGLGNQFTIYPRLNYVLTNIEEIYSELKGMVTLVKGANSISLKDNKIVYIPTLRTAHTLYKENLRIEENIFKETYLKNYNLNKDLDLFTGLDLYNQILNKRNSHSEDRKGIEIFEKFLGDNFFGGDIVQIVANFDYKKTLNNENYEKNIIFKIGNEPDRFLFQLGDGIQSLIILLFKIFTAEENSIIFIDEPELYLHPGMQRIFLEQIIRNPDINNKNLRFFISTHSNHFLDLTIYESGISIYTFTPQIMGDNKKFEIRNVNQGDNSILRELGVNNSSVFLANCSIWVEGISDRMIIKAMLYAYIMHEFNKDVSRIPKENIDFSFFEYAGSNIEHYVFDQDISIEMDDNITRRINALAMNNRILLIADYDNATGQKEARIEKLKSIEKVNFSFLVSEEFREIENMLSKSIWKKVLIEFCNQNEVKKRRQEIQIALESTIESIRSFESYRKEYVGKFLEKLKKENIPLNEICKKKSRGTGWGTFEDKAKLANLIYDKTIAGEITWEDFTDGNEIIDGYVSQIYRFIKLDK